APFLPGELKVWDAEADPEVRVLRGPAPEPRSSQHLAFSPDGTRLASASAWGSKVVRLWDTRSGQEIRTFTAASEPIRALAFSPDGTRLAVAASDGDGPVGEGEERHGTVQVWDLARGGEVTIDSVHFWAYGAVAFSP